MSELPERVDMETEEKYPVLTSTEAALEQMQRAIQELQDDIAALRRRVEDGDAVPEDEPE